MGNIDEFKSALTQFFDDARDGLDGLRAVAARIMQQNNIAVASLGCINDAFDDLVGTRALPVVRVNLHANTDIALFGRKLQWPDLVDGLGFGINAVGRTKEYGVAADFAGQQMLRRREFELELPRRYGRNIRVCEGVVADLVPFIDHLPQ